MKKVPQDGLEAWVLPALEAKEIPLEEALYLHAQVYAFFSRFFGWLEKLRTGLSPLYKAARHRPHQHLPKAVVAFMKGADELWQEVLRWGGLQETPPWEEAELAQAQEVRNRLVESYLPIAVATVLQGRLGGFDGDEVQDLIAEATAALVSAVERYNPHSSLVRPEVFIREAVLEALSMNKTSKGREHLDVTTRKLVRQVAMARERIHERGEVADLDALVAETKLSQARVEYALEAEQPVLRVQGGGSYDVVDIVPDFDPKELPKTIGQVLDSLKAAGHTELVQTLEDAMLKEQELAVSPKKLMVFERELEATSPELYGYMKAFRLAGWASKALGKGGKPGVWCAEFDQLLATLPREHQKAIKAYLAGKDSPWLQEAQASLAKAMDAYPLAKSFMGAL